MKHRHGALKVLGSNLRSERERRKFTQEKLAEKADLDPSYISGIERGIRNPSVLSLVRIAAAVGTTVSSLTTGLKA